VIYIRRLATKVNSSAHLLFHNFIRFQSGSGHFDSVPEPSWQF
jgi:hypothetical protein